MEADTMMNRERLQRINVVPADDPLPDYPCGFLRCTFEEFPKVIHANQYMFRLLGVTPDSEDWREFIRNNIFFMIPSSERGIMRRYLEAAAESSEPVSVEHDVHNGSGTRTHLIGWIRSTVNRDGGREYHFLYMEAPKPLFSLRQSRERAYEQALKGVYELIIKVDFSDNTIECIHKSDAEQFPYMLGAKLTLSSILKNEFFGHVVERDRERVREFLTLISDPTRSDPGAPMNVRFHRTRSGVECACMFVGTRIDEKTILLCGLSDGSATGCTPSAAADSLVHLAPDPETQGGRDGRKPRVFIRTFGYFDVFVNGEPVVFRYEKSKEMLAILVDRKGSFVANPYLISCLWEDEPYNEKIQSRCRQTAFRLMETLKQYGIEDIVEKVSGRRRIIPEKVDCDCFNHLQGKSVSGQGFNGAYMSDYSWGETTLSALTQNNSSTLV